MLKNILKLKGAQKLSSKEQQKVNGGRKMLPGGGCSVGCNGRTSGSCYAEPDCECPGQCFSSGCVPYQNNRHKPECHKKFRSLFIN